ncbi:MAG: pyridoxal phosphate-dependent aminotransferase [Bacteroidales bacterium]|nr:pyridoxal phosphate-dependent aminotransferase [Bacteroidales bacterium]MCM1147153.1 pyridoxal phosphate-dependent aminotransferase [Bacteroidales bacterium]MCM1205379.1 pyridoxal phosphate-dependent aminotransferase [Bacillota bacterium]MCM1509816.1 pyridoxal phosphate-dependent aminotransferase [Clostridium sp.]
MKYNFDEIVPREGTDSFKLNRVEEICGKTDVLPMWVADMDFRTPPFIIKALEKRIHQGVLGYTCTNDCYYDSICRWCKKQYGMEVKPEMVNYIPGVVAGILLAVQAFTEKGDSILIQQPVYHPFRLVPEAAGRKVVMSPLRRTEENFEMDFDRLRKDIKGCRMMILCNPHNPAGICWSKEDLQTVAHICAEEGVLVVSDEIHCDMVLYGRKHIPFATVSEEARMNSITLQAPTKVFNMPGVVASQAIVFNPEIREKYFGYIWGTDQDAGNVFAYDCVAACYSEDGDEWRKEMLEYVEGNIDLLCSRLAEECPLIKPIRPEASFLVFLDCRELMDAEGMKDQSDLICFFASKAHLALNSGDMFGNLGTGYMRMNLACPRSVLNKAIDLMVEAVKK